MSANGRPGHLLSQTPVRLRKRVHRLLLDGQLLLRMSDRTVRLAPYDAASRHAFELLAEGSSRAELVRQAHALGGEAAVAAAEDTFDRLQAAGFLERLDLSTTVHPLDLARFERVLHYLSEFEHADRSRFDHLSTLRASRVVVIGIGGIGSWIVYSLLCCGVGSLKLIDADEVELSNLNRSILYEEGDLGRAKADAAREAALRFAPRSTVEIRRMVVEDAASLVPEVAGSDLVIATADKPPWLVRAWVAEACHQSAVPLLHPTGFRVGPFYLPGASSCPMCDWAHLVDRHPRQAEILAAQHQVPSCDPGALSFVGTITAGVVAMEAFRLLSGTSSPRTANAIWEMEPDLTATIRPLPPHPGCAVCGDRDARYRLDALRPAGAGTGPASPDPGREGPTGPSREEGR
jgi:bacteriocin biosynthesis cyclodehydratase domain-containing protein